MLPDDPYFDAKDPGSDFPPGLANALQRSVSCEKAAWASGTFPPPGGTSLPWGGGKIVFYRGTVGADSSVVADDSIDWRNRFVMVMGGFYDDAADLPGSGTEPTDQPSWYLGLNQALTAVDLVTGYLKYNGALDYSRIELAQLPSGSVKLEVNSDGELIIHGNGTAIALYPVLLIFCSDQFPTRT